MRGSGHIWAWSLLLLVSLLSRNTGAVLMEHRKTAAGGCESENFMVVASGSLATIGGCYEMNSGYFVGHDQPIYTKAAGALEGIAYAIMGSQGSDKAHDVPRWSIAQIREPGSFTDGADRRMAVEVEALVCTAQQGWRATNSPSTVQDWTCDAGEYGSLVPEEGSASVTCGCSGLDRNEAPAVYAVEGIYVGGGGSGGASENPPGTHRTANVRRLRRAGLTSSASDTTDASENDSYSSNPGS